MKIGIVLLSSNSCYIGHKGEYPVRPAFDKHLITTLARDNVVLCSENTKKTIPRSILKVVKGVTTNHKDEWTVNFGISTFWYLCDLFIIVKSSKPLEGKKFRMTDIYDNYKNLYVGKEVELWLRQ